MNGLNLYTVFHGNLQFSSIPKRDYRKVINNCYGPLLEILKKYENLKFGIEFNALTLQELLRFDKKFVENIRLLTQRGKLEFIGSSYSQAIFPLIPHEVNLKNIKLGMKYYREILGKVPEIFYINEQTFSDGLINLYRSAGVKNIIVDFDNTSENVRSGQSLLYKGAKAISQNRNSLSVLWSSSIAFQKFQRYIFDEISFDDYMIYLNGHFSKGEKRFFCLYAGDWEVFGYSPKGLIRNFENDLQRIDFLFKKLLSNSAFRFVLPHELLSKTFNKKLIRITDYQMPIGSKKQEKYNASRWALAGKNTIFRNTHCFRLYKEIKSLKDSAEAQNAQFSKLEENLLKLWGSDYRTNTTDDKNDDYDDLLSKTENAVKKYSKGSLAPTSNYTLAKGSFGSIGRKSKEQFETGNVKLTLDARKGATIKNLYFPQISSERMLGLVPHGYYRSPRLSADWFSGHCLFEAGDGKKYTDLYHTKINMVDSHNENIIEVSAGIEIPIGSVKKHFRIYKNSPRLDLKYLFNFKKVALRSARIGNVTLDPSSFDIGNFWYASVNGGNLPEVYKVGKYPVILDNLISLRISSGGCLGATDGWIAVGDDNKGFVMTWDKAQIASCPIIHFERTPQGFYGRIQPSIAESDETGFPTFDGVYEFTISYLGLSSRKQLYQIHDFLKKNQ